MRSKYYWKYQNHHQQPIYNIILHKFNFFLFAKIIVYFEMQSAIRETYRTKPRTVMNHCIFELDSTNVFYNFQIDVVNFLFLLQLLGFYQTSISFSFRFSLKGKSSFASVRSTFNLLFLLQCNLWKSIRNEHLTQHFL